MPNSPVSSRTLHQVQWSLVMNNSKYITVPLFSHILKVSTRNKKYQFIFNKLITGYCDIFLYHRSIIETSIYRFCTPKIKVDCWFKCIITYAFSLYISNEILHNNGHQFVQKKLLLQILCSKNSLLCNI